MFIVRASGFRFSVVELVSWYNASPCFEEPLGHVGSWAKVYELLFQVVLCELVLLCLLFDRMLVALKALYHCVLRALLYHERLRLSMFFGASSSGLSRLQQASRKQYLLQRIREISQRWGMPYFPAHREVRRYGLEVCVPR